MTIHQERIDELLDSRISSLTTEPTLQKALRYSLGGGKRIRAQLVYAMGTYLELHKDVLDTIACSIEAIHCYSLIHDDLPAMDNDDFRRGKDSCHKVFGEGMAILVGDALHSLAFEWIVDSSQMDSDSRLKCCRQLLKASGVAGMIQGQAIDIIYDTKTDECAKLKTAKLFEACAALPLCCKPDIDGDDTSSLLCLAEDFGRTYQLLDDYKDENSIDVLATKNSIDQLTKKMKERVAALGNKASHINKLVSTYLQYDSRND